jgi:general secretion pathway protein J
MYRHPGESRDLVEKDRVLDREGHGVDRRGLIEGSPRHPGVAGECGARSSLQFRRDDVVREGDLAAIRSEQGFTLVELLVSLLIFSLLSAAGVALLSISVRTQESAGARLDDLAALRRAGALMAADLAQVAPRLQRDQAGRTHPAFHGGTGEEGLALAFVRRGWENDDAAPRPTLQKVEYGLVEGRLLRRAYPRVDGAAPFSSVPLIEGVESLRFRYRDQRGEWRDRWDPTDPSRLPRAVEMVVAVAGAGTTRQLFLAGADL